MAPRIVPTYDVELALAREAVGRSAAPRGGAVIVGVDEVGRGALAGPVVIGACAVLVQDGRCVTPLPEGIRDSKALTARRRELLAPAIRESAHAWALGSASPEEIDERGIMAVLALATARAIAALPCAVDAIIMDGSVDVITPALADLRRSGESGSALLEGPPPRVHVQVKADRDCASVAAASILAKVDRDAGMVALAESAPDYGWGQNKGYGAAAHRAAIARLGPHAAHRRSWNLLPSAQAALLQIPTSGTGVLWEARDGDPRPGEEEAQR
ncbi:ribonuclease HII [Brachybacterium sp. JHP9]|uniref:Ribonuclease HII n=1 Tax=Brachybacterium equifaecis TaxID=2910770 RepID=A0ABT0QY98_9MICO|nr:ribonuclease HII [Brachybacterium equifaecis]MCL6422123.1 ribonuclease HII [Brachybacterium equifaecis]